MKLINFIKNNQVHWETFLKTIGVKIEKKDNLVLLKYNLIETNFTELDGIAKYCRGSIIDIDKNQYVAKAFNKFWNYGEPKCDTIDWNTAQVQEKLDGSIIKLWYYNKKWNISTNGKIDAYESHLRPNLQGIETFGDLFVKAWNDCKYPDFNTLDKNITYIFELCTPLNRVVIEHKDYTPYFLSAFQTKIAKEVKIKHNFKTFETFKFNTLEEVIDTAWGLSFKEEGYVVVDGNYNRCKIKSKEYLLAHSMANNDSLCSPKALYNAIIEGDIDEIIAYFPEYEKQINIVRNKMDDAINNILETNRKLKESQINLDSMAAVANFLKKESKVFYINMCLFKGQITEDEIGNHLFKKMKYKKFADIFGKIIF